VYYINPETEVSYKLLFMGQECAELRIPDP